LIFAILFAVEELSILGTKVAPFPSLMWGVAFFFDQGIVVKAEPDNVIIQPWCVIESRGSL
jgi:hypothetical protein